MYAVVPSYLITPPPGLTAIMNGAITTRARENQPIERTIVVSSVAATDAPLGVLLVFT